MARFLDWVGRFCARNRRWVLTVWVAVAVGTGILGVTGGGTFVQQDRLSGTETQRSIDLLHENFPEMTGPATTVVFHPQEGVSLSDWRVAVQVGKAIKQMGELPRVATVAFGSYLATGVPIIVSLCAMAIAYSLVHFGASIGQVHPTAPMVAAMLGLGAGIDYALFVVTRHRTQMSAGMDAETSIGRAMATSGHAVVFAGGTVVFAICGLWFAGIAFIGIIGLATALAVALTVIAALTLLPAVLGFLGAGIDRYRLPHVQPDKATHKWERWGRHVDRHAWPYTIGATALLLFLAIPMLSLRFGMWLTRCCRTPAAPARPTT